MAEEFKIVNDLNKALDDIKENGEAIMGAMKVFANISAMLTGVGETLSSAMRNQSKTVDDVAGIMNQFLIDGSRVFEEINQENERLKKESQAFKKVVDDATRQVIEHRAAAQFAREEQEKSEKTLKETLQALRLAEFKANSAIKDAENAEKKLKETINKAILTRDNANTSGRAQILSVSEVIEIMELRDSGKSFRDIAQIYGVSHTTVRKSIERVKQDEFEGFSNAFGSVDRMRERKNNEPK